MLKRPLTLEHAFYALALVIGLGLRFLHLGALPLSDFEADWAMQALQITRGLHPVVGPNPGYVHLTAVLFAVFGGTNFLARFWPALAGCLLVLGPWALRGRLGRVPALVLAFGLAIDPGLVGLSRQAGGPMLAVASVVLALMAWSQSRRALAGFFAGLALLSGAAAWYGILGLALAWAFGSRFQKEAASRGDTLRVAEPTRLENLRTALVWGLGTVLVLGSLLAFSPQGLVGIVSSLLDFLRSWWMLSDVPFWQTLVVLPAYEILPLGFGLAGIVRGLVRKEPDSMRLSIWAGIAFLLALVHPGRQAGDLIWLILPLWALAALELNRHLDFAGRNLWELAGVGTLVFVLLVFSWLDLAYLTTIGVTSELARMRLLLLLAVVLLIVLGLLLVAAGWSIAVARLGGVWGCLPALVLFTLAMTTGAAGIRQPLTVDLWQGEPRPGRLEITIKVANQISDLNTGAPDQLPITIVDVDSAALRWLFRDWQLSQTSRLEAGENSPLLITPIDMQLGLVDAYRGEAQVLGEIPDWSSATTDAWLKWFLYRQMPVLREEVILWVRSDLMLDTPVPPAAP